MDCQSGGRGSPMKRGWMIDCTTKLGAQETTMTISIREGPPINCPSRAGGQAMASRPTAIRTEDFLPQHAEPQRWTSRSTPTRAGIR